jgi:hypothetical protein
MARHLMNPSAPHRVIMCKKFLKVCLEPHRLETFKEFPPSQRAASFTIDQAMERLKQQLSD